MLNSGLNKTTRVGTGRDIELRSRRLLAPMAALAVAALLAACGSSSSSSGGSSSSSGSSGSSAGSSTSASSGSGTSVAVGKVAGFGSVLETSSGQALYVLSTDPSGSSKCSGACAKTWKPLTTSGSPSAGSGVTSSLLSDFKRSDGTTQVLYDKHALYTHSGNAATVAGTASDGGVWYLINAKGSPVKSSTAGGY
jgi:predicted lipoprotein with Yx(FWY)xxD motif